MKRTLIKYEIGVWVFKGRVGRTKKSKWLSFLQSDNKQEDEQKDVIFQEGLHVKLDAVGRELNFFCRPAKQLPPEQETGGCDSFDNCHGKAPRCVYN